MNISPAAASRPRSQRELLAMAKQLPEPALSEARREEMRTAFLSTVRGVRSSKRARALAARGKGKRLLMVAAFLFAGAGFAAAAWRITACARPVLGASAAPVAMGGPSPRSVRERSLGEALEAAPGPTGAETAPPELPASVGHRRAANRPAHRAVVAEVVGQESATELEIAFAQGWSSLRSGQFDAAGEAFGRAASRQNENALSEDASFWRGVAFDRARRFADAREAFIEFLARYPDSDRAGEASVMLGWLLLRAGDAADAGARFKSALGDPAARVRRSALAGLAASGRRHAD